MGADYLFLDCVRGVSFVEAGGAVTRALAREGWKPLRSAAPRSKNGVAHDVREVAVHVQDGWTIVEEKDSSRFPVAWAYTLAKELRGVAICVRSDSDNGTFRIDRYDGDQDAGSVREPRRRGHAVQVRARFLVDFASSPKRRASLAKGVPCGPHESADKIVIKLARLAGLPRLRDPYHYPTPTHRFYRPRRSLPTVGASQVREIAARLPQPAKLQLRDSFHIRGITRQRLLRGVASVLNEAGLVERTAPHQNKERDLFLAASGAWQSLGEATYRDDGSPFGGPELVWAIYLSKRLAVPVLMVRAHETWIELAVFKDGRRGTIVTVPPQGGPVDLGPLAAVGLDLTDRDSLTAVGQRLRRTRTRSAAARQIGTLLGLPHPVLEGKLQGVVVSLCTTSEALRPPPA